MKYVIYSALGTLLIASCGGGGGGGPPPPPDDAQVSVSVDTVVLRGAVPAVPSGASVSIQIDGVEATIDGGSWSHAVSWDGSDTAVEVAVSVNGHLEESRMVSLKSLTD